MTFWCYAWFCNIVVRISVTPLIIDELNTPGIKLQMAALDKEIQEKIGDNINENDIALPGLSLPPSDIFEDVPSKDDTPRGDWDPVEAN